MKLFMILLSLGKSNLRASYLIQLSQMDNQSILKQKHTNTTKLAYEQLHQTIRQIKDSITLPNVNLSNKLHPSLANDLINQAVSILKSEFRQSFSNNQKARYLANKAIELIKQVSMFFDWLYAQVKQITSANDPYNWDHEWNKFTEEIFIDKSSQQKNLFLKVYIQFLKSHQIALISRVNIDFELQQFKRLLKSLKSVNQQIIIVAIAQIQDNASIIIHSKLLISLELKFETIWQINVNILRNNIGKFTFKEGQTSIQFLYYGLVKQLKELTDRFLKLSCSKFFNLSSDETLQRLTIEIQQKLRDKKDQDILTLRDLIQNLFKQNYELLKFDTFNNLNKTFLIELTRFDKEKLNFAMHQIQKFTYQFAFCRNNNIFIKNFKSWWRGKLQKQNKIMYQKHLQLIRYLIYTMPPGTVQYYRVQQQEKGVHMRFIMEKGDLSFINFDQGYQYFRDLPLNDKLKFILDISQALMELEEHGINHNDITVRNIVKVGDRFKLIDFDVARMIDTEFKYSKYNVYHTEAIKNCREAIIKNTEYLMRKELREERIISRTNSQQATTPIENINRLAQYYNLPNEIEILKKFKDKKEFHTHFTHEQRFRIIFQYQKLVVGKRDCNKFAFMILKLMYMTDQKNYQFLLTSRVEQFIRDIQRQRDSEYIDKYTKYFRLSNQLSQRINSEFLELITFLITPQLEKRIPIKLFYYKIFQIFRINNYPLKIRPISPKQGLPKYLDLKSAKIHPLLQPSTLDRASLIAQIESIFKKNIQYSITYQQALMKIYDSLSTSLANPNKLIINRLSNKQQNLERYFQGFNKLITTLQKPIFVQIKKSRDQMKCYIHGLKIEAQCCQNGCKQKWLCNRCIYNLFFEKMEIKDPLSHCKNIAFSQSISNVIYHKIEHFHQQGKVIDSKIICLLATQSKFLFQCRKCLQSKQLSGWDKIYYVNMQKRQIYDCFNQKSISSIPILYRVPSQYKDKASYDQIFNGIDRQIEISIQQREDIQDMLSRSKNIIQDWFRQLGRINKKHIQSIHTKPQIIKVESFLYYLSIHDNLLQLLQAKKPFDRQNFVKSIGLKDLVGMKGATSNKLLLNTCEYFIDRVNFAIDSICTQLQQIRQKSQQKRSLFVFTSQKAFDGFELTKHIRQKFGSRGQKVQKRKPSAKEILRAQQRKKRQQKKQKQQLKQSLLQQSMNHSDEIGQSSFENKPSEGKTNCSSCNQSNQSAAFCTTQSCETPFLCQQCVQTHKKIHNQSQYYYFNQYLQRQNEEELNLLTGDLNKSKSHLKVQKLLQKIISQVQLEMIQYIDFVQEIIMNINKDNLKRLILEKLKRCILDENRKKFIDYLWIISHLFKDPIKFMQIVQYSVERYVLQLTKMIDTIEQAYKVLDEIKTDKLINDERHQKELEDWFTRKYRLVVNNSKQDTPMAFDKIFQRHRGRVNQLTIQNIKQTNSNQSERESIKTIQLSQFHKKLLRNHYNSLEIHVYWTSFKPMNSNKLDLIQKFSNLKILVIKDETTNIKPIVFKSIHIQGLLNQTFQLKQLKLYCLNGFDIYCNQLIKKKHRDCLIELDSYSQIASNIKWINEVFPQQSKINVPFQVEGQIISDIQNQNIQRGQFCLDLTTKNIQNTLKSLQMSKGRIANKLKLVFNALRQNCQQNQQNISIFDVKEHFWCRITYGRTSKSHQVEIQINRRYHEFLPIFKPVQSKFTQVRFLSLHGILINGGINTYAKQLKSNISNFLASFKELQTLQLVKCFGMSLLALFENTSTLRRLIIQESIFTEQNIDNVGTFIQLQWLILKRVGLFEIAPNQRLLSRQFGSILSKLKLITLQTLIINQFYELQIKQLEWIKNNPIKRLSLRRCFKINQEIYPLIKSMQQLEYFDFTDTDIDIKSFRTKMQIDQYFYNKKITICNEMTNFADSNINSINFLKQLIRVAKYYHIKQLQKATNKDTFKLVPLDLNQIKQVTIRKVKIRQRTQYYLLQLLAKLPELQYIIFEDCQWKTVRANKKELLYDDFKFITGLSQIKELSLINCNIRNFQQTKISEYSYLRKLVLRHNPYLEDIEKLQFYELIELDLSYTGTKSIKFDLHKIARMKLINIQHTNISEFPQQLLTARALRIVRTSLPLPVAEEEKHKKFYNLSNIEEMNLLQTMRASKQYQDADGLVVIKNMNSTTEKRQINQKTRSYYNKIDKFNSGCLYFSENEFQKHNEWIKLLMRYQLHKVEMEVKGNYQWDWYKLFCSQLIATQQLKKEQNIEYTLMKIDQLNYHQQYSYEMFNFTPNQAKQKDISLASTIELFHNKYQTLHKIWQSGRQFFAMQSSPERQFKGDKLSSFIIKKSKNHNYYENWSSVLKIVNKKKTQLIQFLQEYTKTINQLNIMNTQLICPSLGINMQSPSPFKILHLQKLKYISQQHDSSIYKLVRSVLLRKKEKVKSKDKSNQKTRNKNNEQVQEEPEIKAIRIILDFSTYRKKNVSGEALQLMQSYQNQHSLIISKFKETNFSKSITDKLVDDIPIFNHQEQNEIDDIIQEIIICLLVYKRIVNELQLAIVKHEIQLAENSM